MAGKYLICEDCENADIFESEEIEKAWAILFADKERTFSVVQISPSVRFSIGEKFGMHSGEDCMGKIATALCAMGADAVVDAAMGADVVALLQTQELFSRKEKGANTPLFSSKCVAFSEYLRTKYPDLEVSEIGSENAVNGALLKEYYKKQTGKTVRIISVEPCKEKKALQNVDVVVTAEELELMLAEVEEVGVSLRTLKKRVLDIPLGVASGSAYISEISGGMTEGIVRCLSNDKSAEYIEKLSYSGLYGLKARREATLEIDGRIWRFAVVCGLEEAETLIQDVRSGKSQYDYVEVSACAGGCVCGSDLPNINDEENRLRTKYVQAMDCKRSARCADVNPPALESKKQYEAWLRKKQAGLLEAETDVETVELKDEFVSFTEENTSGTQECVEDCYLEKETTQGIIEEIATTEDKAEETEKVEIAESVEAAVEDVKTEEEAEELQETSDVEEGYIKEKRDPYYTRLSQKDRRKMKRSNKKK